MGTTKKQYVKALLELLETESDTTKVVKHLKEVMDRRGHVRLLPAVLSEVSRVLDASTRSDVPQLTLAEQSDEKTFTNEVTATTGDQAVNVKIDPTIIGGFILDYQGLRLDKSYKSSLLTWYRSVTKQN